MIKNLIIRHLASRIANDAIQHATALAELDVLKNQKEVEEHGDEPIAKTEENNSEETSDTKTE